MTHRNFPELFPKITASEIAKSANVGCAADLRTLLNFLRLFGAISPGDRSIRLISRRIYETQEFETKRTNKKTGVEETCSEIDDESAYLRFDNVLSGKHPMIEREVEYFRLCLRHSFGDNIGSVSDDRIVSGSAQLLIRELLGNLPRFDWQQLDPLDALLAMALATEGQISPAISQIGGNSRWIQQDKDEEVLEFPGRATLSLEAGAHFVVNIPKKDVRVEPLVLNFARSPSVGKTKGVRAQVMKHVVASDDKEGPWRVSKPRNKPFTLNGHDNGEYGFLVIGGIGRSVDQLFPKAKDLPRLGNSDLENLYEALAVQLASGTPPKLGVIFYTVHP